MGGSQDSTGSGISLVFVLVALSCGPGIWPYALHGAWQFPVWVLVGCNHRLRFNTLLERFEAGPTDGATGPSPLRCSYNNAIGFTGEPVPPTTRSGLTVSMNS